MHTLLEPHTSSKHFSIQLKTQKFHLTTIAKQRSNSAHHLPSLEASHKSSEGTCNRSRTCSFNVKAYFQKSNFPCNRGLMFHRNTASWAECMKTSKSSSLWMKRWNQRAHPYGAVLRNGTWNFMQTPPEGELPICKRGSARTRHSIYIPVARYLNEEETRLVRWNFNLFRMLLRGEYS